MNHQKTNKKQKKEIHGVQLFSQTWAFTVQSTTLLFQLVRAHRHARTLTYKLHTCTRIQVHTPWTIKADRRGYNRTAALDKSIL